MQINIQNFYEAYYHTIFADEKFPLLGQLNDTLGSNNGGTDETSIDIPDDTLSALVIFMKGKLPNFVHNLIYSYVNF